MANGVTYTALSEDQAHSVPPKRNRTLAFLTSGWMRLLVLIWAAYMLTTLAFTWYSITSYHIVGSGIRDDEGAWGQIYDASRSASRTGITAAVSLSDAVKGKGVHTHLDNEEFDIVEKNFKEPTGWHATLIHTWMVIATVLNFMFASITWFIVVKRSSITMCGLSRFDADQEVREHRQEIAADITLCWLLLVPFMSWAIERVTGYHDLGIAPHLYRRMVSIGPMVMIGQKMLVFLVTTLKDAEDALNSSGDVAWALCSRDVASKVREVKHSAVEIFEKSLIMNRGPMWLQRVCQSAFLVAIFETRPFGIVMAILGLVDSVIVTRLEKALLRVIPSWIDDAINQVEAKVNQVGQDATKLSKSLDEHLKTIQGVVTKGAKLLDEASDHLTHAKAMVAKHSSFIGPGMTAQMEKTLEEVSRPLGVIQKDFDFTASEVKRIEAEIEKEATVVLDKVLEKVKALTKLLDSFRPESILARLEHLADEALYGELLKAMQKNKAAGAVPLQFSYEHHEPKRDSRESSAPLNP